MDSWYRIVEAITSQSISMIDRSQLRMGSQFVTTESTTLLFPGIVPPVPIPHLTAGKSLFSFCSLSVPGLIKSPTWSTEEEISEILEHLRFARAKSLATWRRFVIVVGDSTPELVDRAGKLGVSSSSPGPLSTDDN